MTSASADLYPQYCFHLSPTFKQWCLLHATAVHALDSHPEFEGQGLFFHRNLPIKWVRLVGVVVAIDDVYNRRIFTLDDSSGACIECNVLTKVIPAALPTSGDAAALAFAPRRLEFEHPGCEEIKVGAVVDVKGSVALFRDEKTVKIQKVRILRSTAQEVALWERRSEFRREVLEQPWVVGEKQLRRCRREAEGRDKRQRREEKERKRREAEDKPVTGLESSRGRIERDAAATVDETPEAEEAVDGLGRPRRPRDSHRMNKSSQGLGSSRSKHRCTTDDATLTDGARGNDCDVEAEPAKPTEAETGYPGSKAAQGLERSRPRVWHAGEEVPEHGRMGETADGLEQLRKSKPGRLSSTLSQGLESSRPLAWHAAATANQESHEEEGGSRMPRKSMTGYPTRKAAEGLESARRTERYKPEDTDHSQPRVQQVEMDGFGRPRKARGSRSNARLAPNERPK